MVNTTADNPLDQLRPIILPDYDVGIWPLATGWWLILAVIILLLAGWFFLWPILRKRREQKQRRENTLLLLTEAYALCSQNRDKPKALQDYLQKSNQIFKRVVHANKSLAPFAPLTGQPWIDFISRVGAGDSFAKYYGDHLYASSCNENINLDDLHQWAGKWVGLVDKQTKKINRELAK